MDDDETTSMRRTVRLAIILLVVVGLYLAGFNVLLSVVVGMIPLWYSWSDSSPPADDDSEPQKLAKQLHQAHRGAWHELADRAHLLDFLRPWVGHGGQASLLPPRVGQWPPLTGDPGADAFAEPGPVTADQVAGAVTAVSERWRTLVITGGEDTGKTTLMLLMLLQAEEVRDAVGPNALVPLRISLAGWPDDPDLTLREWLSRRVREDYPGLLGPGQSLERLLDWLWGADGLAADRVLLFLDGIDVIDAPHRTQVLRRVMSECSRRLAVIAVRTDTWLALTPQERHDWPELRVAGPDVDDVTAFLAPVPELAERLNLDLDGSITEPLWRNPRLLQLLRESYPDPDQPPAWLTPTPATTDEALQLMWADLLTRVNWPDPNPNLDPNPDPDPDPEPIVRTLRWVANQGLFTDTRFEWWKVLGHAAADSALTSVNSYLKRHRAGSAVAWTLRAFGAGLLALLVLLGLGIVQGYDHASHGLLSAGGLRGRDIKDWSWDLLSVPHILGNPVYLAVLQALLAVLVVGLLSWFGRELEHPDGGQPQTLRLSLPGGRDLPLLVRAVPKRALQSVGLAALAGGVFELSGSGIARQIWASCAFVLLFFALLTWLHWCAEAPTAPSHRTPAGMFAADRSSTKVVALALGGVLALTAGALSWWFTAYGHVPTVGQCLGIITAVSVAIGIGRGLFLGSGMGTSWMLRLRPGFGLGYGARLLALEEGLKQRPPTPDSAAPLTVTRLLGLSQTGTPLKAKPLSSRRTLSPEALLRPVGSHLRLRESGLETYLKDATGPPPTLLPERAGWLTVLAIVPAVVLALLTATGSAAVMLPRIPCFTWSNALHLPSGLAVDELHGKPRSRTWLENGQCVGFIVPGAEGWPPGSFGIPGGVSAGQEDAVRTIMAQIAEANRKVAADDGRAVTVLFLAPLTRTESGNAINGLWQLQGALAALKAINEQGALPIRLVVANSGEDFTSGPSVVQTIARSFPQDGPWAIKAVIGIAQSRASARAALAELRDVPIIAGSVSGRQLRQGIGSDDPLRTPFLSVSPGDDQTALAMLDPALIAKVRERDPKATGPATVRVIGDVKDPYFSGELMVDLSTALRSNDRGLRLGQTIDLSALDDSAKVVDTAHEICADPHSIWLFAGRGNQLTDLDHRIAGRCKPMIIGGPGAISAVSASNEPTARFTSMANLFSYSLVSKPFAPGLGVTDPSPEIAVERGSDRATGYTAMLTAAHRQSEAACPGPPGPLGMQVDRNGHNTLAAGPDPCAAASGSSIWFCPFTGGQCIPTTTTTTPTTTSTPTTTPATPTTPSPASTPATPAPTPATPGPATPTSPAPTSPAPTSPAPAPAPTERAVVQRPDNNPAASTGVRWYTEPKDQPAYTRDERLPWDTRLTVLCRVPGETKDVGWVGVTAGTGAPGQIGGSGFVRWKVRLADRNVYLRFPDLKGKLASGEPTSERLPTTLPSCSGRAQLNRLLDAQH